MLSLLWVLLIPLFLFLQNLFKWKKTLSFKKHYDSFWSNYLSGNNVDENNIVPKRQEIVALLKGANLNPIIKYFAEPMGLGRVADRSANSFDNLFIANEEFISANMQAFSEATEVYRKRMWDSINPLVWLDTLFFLPQKILNYIGISENNLVSKVLNVIYWILGVITPILVEPLRSYLEGIIRGLLS